MKLVVAGSAALDTIRTPREVHEDTLGGSSVYASLSASFFSRVALISVVGEDFPRKYLKVLRKRNIDISGLNMLPGRTFRWEAAYDGNLEHARTIRTEINVFDGFTPSIPYTVGGNSNLLLANIDPGLQNYILKKIKPSGLVACDTMNLWIERDLKGLLKLLKKIDIFLINDAEARQLSGEKNLMDAARYISSKGAGMTVIKKGEHGVLFFNKGLCFTSPAYLVGKVKDPTGAGDTFAGGMMGYITGKKKIDTGVLRRALVHGSIMASFAVERFSADSLARIGPEDIRGRYKEFRELTRF